MSDTLLQSKVKEGKRIIPCLDVNPGKLWHEPCTAGPRGFDGHEDSSVWLSHSFIVTHFSGTVLVTLSAAMWGLISFPSVSVVRPSGLVAVVWGGMSLETVARLLRKVRA